MEDSVFFVLQRGKKKLHHLLGRHLLFIGSLFGFWVASEAAATVLLESVYLLIRVRAGESYCLGSVSFVEQGVWQAGLSHTIIWGYRYLGKPRTSFPTQGSLDQAVPEATIPNQKRFIIWI